MRRAKVVLTQDKETAHSAAKSALRIYASLPNYEIVGKGLVSPKMILILLLIILLIL